MRLKNKINRVKESKFFQSVLVLVGGAAFSQLISIAILPFLTRLYSPDDFNVLAFYASVLAVLSAVSSLRYEIAIPLPEEETEAEALLAISIFFTAVTSFLVFIFFYMYADSVLLLFKLGGDEWNLYLLSIGVFAAGTYNAFRSWATRKKQFAHIAKTRIQQSLGSATSRLLLGWFQYAPLGLIVGQIVEAGAGVRGLLNGYLSDVKGRRHGGLRKSILSISKSYVRFPKYSVLESLANSAGTQVPILLIVALAVGGEAGFLLLATRVMAGPIGLIGSAVAQVYFSSAATEYRSGGFDRLTIRTVTGLIKIGVGPLICMAVLAPLAAPLVLGDGWGRVGEIILWMLPWTVMQLISSPISMSMHVVGAQRSLMALTIVGFILRVGGLFIGYSLTGILSVELYSVLSAIYYLLCFMVYMFFSGVKLHAAVSELFPAFVIPLLWLAFALMVKFIWSAL